jgi:hypothetical protein
MTTTNSKQLVQRFNKTVCELLQDIKSVYPNLTESIQTFNTKYDVASETNTTYLNYFIIHINPLSKYIASKSAELFTKADFLEGIDIQSIMNDPESAGNHEVIWKYLESLYLLSHKYLNSLNTDDNNDENVVEQLKAMGFDESYMKEQTEQLMKIIANMQIPLAGSTTTETTTTTETADANSTKPKEDVKLPPEMEKMTEQMFGGMIGNLAKEIAAGIDPSTLNIDPNNPQALLQGLLSGENSNLMGLVQNISGKLQSKIESGELNQDALFNEANSIMGNFKNMPGFEGLAGGAGGAGGFDPSMMMNMFSAMGGMSGLGGLGGSSGANGTKKDPNKNLSLLPKNHPKRKGAGK